MSSIARKRLTLERSDWRKDPFAGFHIVSDRKSDGTINPFRWICYIPGKKGGLWEGGLYELTMDFDADYPSKPPKCRFKTVLFHPNIYPSGSVCLSILNEDEDWKPSITVKQILIGIQDLMEHPNIASPAQVDPFMCYQTDREEYNRKVREQAIPASKVKPI